MKYPALISAFILLLTASPLTANLLVNSGFEDPITFDGPPFVGSWEGFSGAGASAGNSNVMPHGGLLHLNLSIANTINTFAGAFQDVPGLVSGTDYVFSAWHASPSDPLDVGVEIRIEWRDSVSNTEVSRTPNFTPVPGAAYSQFSLTATVPAGADVARVVYAIQSFSTSPLGNGFVFVDDASFTVVPEPSATVLAGAAGLGLAFFRRRRSD